MKMSHAPWNGRIRSSQGACAGLLVALGAIASVTSGVVADDVSDPLAPWRHAGRIGAVAPESGRHTIHSYFNTCPESPDGKAVLFFSSTAKDGQRGDVVMRDRISGSEKILAANLEVEDAHRVACQQWVSQGRRVVYHGERNGEWLVACVDLASGDERILARGQLSCWGRPDADLVPLYGPHWNPGAHRSLDLVNVATGEIQTVVTVDAVKAAFPDWFDKSFGDQPPSIFFPVLSPDLSHVFFKMALAGNGNPRSKGASDRQGLLCYDLRASKFSFMNPKWGHPSWHPDQRTIVEADNLLYDSEDGKVKRLAGLPKFHGDHPSASPDGRLLVTDTTMEDFGGKATDWGVVLIDPAAGKYLILHSFDNSHGAKSWRVSHPHPVFNADGSRIYFNVSSTQWTQLHVAQRAGH